LSEKEPVEYIAQVSSEMKELHDFLEDEKLDRALELAIKCLHNPNVPASKVRALIVELQAISVHLSVNAVVYSTIKRDRAGTENNHKKNIYYSMRDAVDNLVSALKYCAKD
jgi:hypothetical protein